MKQKFVRLTESELRKVIKESVQNILNEMDYKTYANAAKKLRNQYRTEKDPQKRKELFDRYYEMQKYAAQNFRDNYVGDMRYDTFGDKAKGKHSPTFDTSNVIDGAYGAINGTNKSGNKIFSTSKGKYHTSNNGYTSPKTFFKDNEVADKFMNANDELWDYSNDNYKYDSLKNGGKGQWLKNESKNVKLTEQGLYDTNESWYDEEDYNGNVGEPGMIRSYDIGYMTTENAEQMASDNGYSNVKDFLTFWWNEVSADCPWTWERKGNGYGFNGTTIAEIDNVVIKDIYGQIIIDEYPQA